MTVNFSPGDYVKIRLALEEIEGRVLESSDNSIVLLKLNSGYNIGIKKENILAGRVIKKYKEKKEKYSMPQDDKLPKVGLIVTGGTIASKASQATGGVRPVTDVGEFLSFYPEILKIVNVKKLEIPFMMFSENMSSEDWIKLAEEVEKMLDNPEIKGVIVSHGTDTLGYTAAALSFFLRGLNKPVVLTYAQRSIDRASSDANLNLQCAARMAISNAAEVMIVGHASINDDFCYAIRGTRARKIHSSRRDAFKSINTREIAKVWPDKVKFVSDYKPRSKEKAELDSSFTDKVALIKYYPGQSPAILDYYALKCKGIIIEGTGLGHVPGSESRNSWVSSLKKHIRDGLVVCMATQCISGRTDSYVYSTGRELSSAGVIYLEDMLPETALVKLGWVLGHRGWRKFVKEKMLENFSGEISNRLEFL